MTNSWKFYAACRGTDLEIWFSDKNADIDEAKRICARCPVFDACLADTLATDLSIAYGVRAGLSGQERTELRKKRQAKAAAVP